MMSTTSQVLVTAKSDLGEVEASNQEEALIASLMTLAHSDPKPKAKPVPEKRSIFGTRNSRFWFQLDEPEEVRQAKFKKKVLPRVDADIEDRLAIFKKEVPATLRARIEEIREFFLKEIAPITMSTHGGAEQAKQVIERMTDSKVDSTLASHFDQMVNRAARIKLAQFVQKLFGLENYEDLLAKPVAQNSELAQIMKMLQTMSADLDKIKIGPQGELQRGHRPSGQ